MIVISYRASMLVKHTLRRRGLTYHVNKTIPNILHILLSSASFNPAEAELCSISIFSSHPPTQPARIILFPKLLQILIIHHSRLKNPLFQTYDTK